MNLLKQTNSSFFQEETPAMKINIKSQLNKELEPRRVIIGPSYLLYFILQHCTSIKYVKELSDQFRRDGIQENVPMYTITLADRL